MGYLFWYALYSITDMHHVDWAVNRNKSDIAYRHLLTRKDFCLKPKNSQNMLMNDIVSYMSYEELKLAVFGCNFVSYTGCPRKNATLTINNFKKTRDRMKKKMCARWHQDRWFWWRRFVLWPFFWGDVIFKICPSISKVTIYVPKFFHCLASPGKVSALAL